MVFGALARQLLDHLLRRRMRQRAEDEIERRPASSRRCRSRPASAARTARIAETRRASPARPGGRRSAARSRRADGAAAGAPARSRYSRTRRARRFSPWLPWRGPSGARRPRRGAVGKSAADVVSHFNPTVPGASSTRRPDEGGGEIGDLERPARHLEDAGDQRHRGAQRPEEAADEDARTPQFLDEGLALAAAGRDGATAARYGRSRSLKLKPNQ